MHPAHIIQLTASHPISPLRVHEMQIESKDSVSILSKSGRLQTGPECSSSFEMHCLEIPLDSRSQKVGIIGNPCH